jgi:hypothetical protein
MDLREWSLRKDLVWELVLFANDSLAFHEKEESWMIQ